MSEKIFNFVTGGNGRLLECDKKVYAYASVEPLQFKGKYNLTVQVPQIHNSLYTKLYVMSGNAATLIGCEASEFLGVLRVNAFINSCYVKPHDFRNVAGQIDRKALLKAKLPKCFKVLANSKDIN